MESSRAEIVHGDAGCRPRHSVELIFERSIAGHRGYRLPRPDPEGEVALDEIPKPLRRAHAPHLPEVTEPETVRHYIGLSLLNHHVDRDVYPLGSCTMKYNPKINEEVARIPGIGLVHPHAPDAAVQGMLELLWTFSRDLAEILGMAAVSLHPAAGAQGELLGMKLFRAYHAARGRQRVTVLVPDSAHGTNPASVALSGYRPVQIGSNADGRIDLAHVAEKLGDDTAGIMITNPNTLGLFEKEIRRICDRVHAAGGLVYMDGANLNALLGIARPGDMGIDVAHVNLHKTFSTPHGGGGPGSGPVGVSAALEPFLPAPFVERSGDRFAVVHARKGAVGPLHPAFGNTGVVARAFAYLRSLGPDGLAAVARAAIVNANYLMQKSKGAFPVTHDERCMHEFVASGEWTKNHGVRVADVAKRILDYGFHAPTVSFPLIVPDALMIEPTETETRPSLDRFGEMLHVIAREVRERPDLLRAAPRTTCVGRLDEATAARELKLRWTPEGNR